MPDRRELDLPGPRAANEKPMTQVFHSPGAMDYKSGLFTSSKEKLQAR